MKRITFALLYALLTVAATAQTIWVRTNEISGNVSPSESLTAVAGAIRLTVYSTDGGSAADLSGSAVRFLITDLRDDKIIVSNSPAVVVSGSAHRGEATVSAGQPYAVRLMAYPDGGEAYALYWATLTVTNPPSAGTSANISLYDIGAANVTAAVGRFTDLYVSGNIDVGGSLEAIDTMARTGRVAKIGDTITGPITGTTFFADAFVGGGQRLTGLDYGSISNAPAIPSFDDVLTNRGHTINGQAVTNGAAITVAAGGLPVAVDQYGKVGYSNAAGDFITWEGASAATGSTLHLSFESADDLTNFFRFNFGSYTAEVVRGRLLITASAESVDQTRALAVLNPATNTACFMTAKLIGSGAVGIGANQQYGIGMGVSMTNSWRQLRLRQTGGVRHFRGYDANLTASASFATGGTSTYAADPNATLETLTIEQLPVWVGADHDGVLTLRYFVAKDNGYGQPARWLQIGSKTNATPGSYWGLVFASPTYGQGAPSWLYDDFTFTSGGLLQ